MAHECRNVRSTLTLALTLGFIIAIAPAWAGEVVEDDSAATAREAALRAFALEFGQEGLYRTAEQVAEAHSEACEAGYAPSCEPLRWQIDGESDLPRAAEVLAPACDDGDLMACVVAGWDAVQGVSGIVDHLSPGLARGLELFGRACDGGFAWGCNDQGTTHWALGTPEDLREADRLLGQACADGVGNACAIHGELLATGEAGEQDPEGALAEAERGCDLGSLYACDLAGSLLSFGWMGKPQPVRGRPLFRRACEGGYGQGCGHLGQLEEYGVGGRPDMGAAMAAYRRGCEMDEPLSCGLLADALEAAGTPAEQVVELLHEACDGGNSTSCESLAARAYRGDDGPADLDRAFDLYSFACGLGGAKGCLHRAEMIRLGEVEGREMEEAAAALWKSCQWGEGIACAKLAELIRKEEVDPEGHLEPYELYRLSCDLGYGIGCYNTATMARKGEAGVEVGDEEIAALNLRACDLGIQRGCRRVASAAGDEATDAAGTLRALEALEDACEGGEAESCRSLGDMLWRRDSGVQDLEGALAAWSKAAALAETAYADDATDWLTALDAVSDLQLLTGAQEEGLRTRRRAVSIAEEAYGAQDERSVDVQLLLCDTLQRLARYVDALQVCQDAVETRDASPDASALARASAWIELGDTHRELSDLDSAGDLYRRALDVRRAELAPDDPSVAMALGRVGSVLLRQSRYVEARAVYEESRQALVTAQGEESFEVAIATGYLAQIHGWLLERERSTELYTNAIGVLECLEGSRSRDALEMRAAVAELSRDEGRLFDSLSEWDVVLEHAPGAFGPQHPQIARWQMERARTLLIMDRDKEALAAAQVAMEMVRAQGYTSKSAGAILGLLAEVHRKRGEFTLGMELLERETVRVQESLGPEHPLLFELAVDLAIAYLHAGDSDRCDSLLAEAEDRAAAQLGKDNSRVGHIALYRMAVAQDTGRFDDAARHGARALEVLGAAQGEEDPLLEGVLEQLIEVDQILGEHERALERVDRAMAIHERCYGPAHLERVDLLLAELASLDALGEYDRAMEVMDEISSLVGNHRSTSQWRAAASALAQMFLDSGNPRDARDLYREVLREKKKAFGTESEQVAFARQNLARAAWRADRPKKACRLQRRALDSLVDLLGPDDEGLVSVFHFLATFQLDAGERGESLVSRRRALALREPMIQRFLAVGSPEQQRSLLSAFAWEVDATVSLHLDELHDDPAAAELAAGLLLSRKGRALDAESTTLRTVRDSLEEGGQARLTALNEAYARLDARRTRGPVGGEGVDAWRAGTEEIERELVELLEELSRESSVFRRQAQEVDLGRVAEPIPPDAALVEFVRFQPRREDWGDEPNPEHYAAYVIRPNGLVHWADLGDAEDIDEAAERFRQDVVATGDTLASGRALRAKVWDPLVPGLEGAEHLLLSPDAQLHLLPFDALPLDDGRPLAAVHGVTYLTSGRDLLGMEHASDVEAAAALVVAAPDFDAELAPVSDLSSEPTRQWTDLPGTAREGRSIHRQLPDSVLLEGVAATEEALKAVHSPVVLHVATHGFFDGRSAADGPDRRGRGAKVLVGAPDMADDEPRVSRPVRTRVLLRSGLVLAGANRGGGGVGNGVLTALEVTGLALEGTELAVLSACRTGEGEIQDGEGIHGLRRALTLAGARSSVVSLWKVDDDATAALMGFYYDHLAEGLGRTEALRRAKMDLAAEPGWAHPFYWAAFASGGDWRPLPAGVVVPEAAEQATP